MNRTILATALCAAAMAMGGCATITGDEMQTVSLRTKAGDSAVDNARCVLKNDKGSWEATTPNFVKVRRSAEDLTVECQKEGVATGFLRAISRATGSMFGNILFGGGVGALIDHNKGTGYSYPDELPVVMGASGTVDRRNDAPKQADGNAAAGSVTPK